MKQAVNFRLSPHALNILSTLETELNTSKTSVIERALEIYAKQELYAKNLILKYAGVLDEKEASSMLNDIKSSKTTKDIKIKL